MMKRVLKGRGWGAIVCILQSRINLYPKGVAAEDRAKWRRMMAADGMAPAGGGCTGQAAGLLLRAGEKEVLERAFLQTTKQRCKQDRDEPGENDSDFEEMKVGSGSKRRREA
mmetsp:Transcript_40661/g.68087  ORF Transcript_40661/g.68087 Transcript_40661/m.68087 type:complete len:112 (+) Transcript_40661:3-338(+)